MKKIPFDLSKWLADKSQKVEDSMGGQVRILAHDLPGDYPIAAAVTYKDDPCATYVESYTADGRDGIQAKPVIFFVTEDEPELTEFEEAIKLSISDYECNKDDGFTEDDCARKHSARLLAIARKQIETDYLESPEAFKKRTDAVYAQGVKDGKAEAIKDLPKWKIAKKDIDTDTLDYVILFRHDGGDYKDYCTVEPTNRLRQSDFYLDLSDLEKLPKE